MFPFGQNHLDGIAKGTVFFQLLLNKLLKMSSLYWIAVFNEHFHSF